MRRRILLGANYTVADNYLKFIARENGTFSVRKYVDVGKVEYSLDSGDTWIEASFVNYNFTTPTIESGNTIMWRGNLTAVSAAGTLVFSSNCMFDVEGTPLTIIHGDNKDKQITVLSSDLRNMFSGCTKLMNIDNMTLPATELAENCYGSMFYNCTSLTSIPSGLLPATTLAKGCYYAMFFGCSSLTSIPSDFLPATELAESCYGSMFYNCTSLTSIPSGLLPVTTLAKGCYHDMFYNCTSLTSIPSDFLPATELAESAYTGMFEACTSLTSVPSSLLPATNLAKFCYQNMFYNCTNLTVAPDLPATVLKDRCYFEMHYKTKTLPDCTNIDFTSISQAQSGGFAGLFAGTNVTDATLNSLMPKNGNNRIYLPATVLQNSGYASMFHECPQLTVAPELPATSLTGYCYSNMFAGCKNLTTIPSELPAMTMVNSCYNSMFSGCTSLTLVATDYLPATTLATWCYSNMFYFCRNLTVGPNLPATGSLPNYCYYDMFSNSGLINAPSISANGTAGESSCRYMFSSCKNLVETPELFCTTLNKDAYNGMFSNCTSLTTVYPLRVTNMSGSGCCYNMFGSCSELTTVPNNLLPASSVTTSAYTRMFYMCEKLTNVPELPATTLERGCYYYMFYQCRALTQLPSNLLPATELAESCYYYMFAFCSSLTSIPSGLLPATTLASSCYSYMFRSCTSLVSVPNNLLPVTTLAGGCYFYMFYSCNNLTNAPELPATTLVSSCYSYMFAYTKVAYVKCLATNASQVSGTTNWLQFVPATGTFVKNSSATWSTGVSGIPNGWTVEDAT